LGYPQALPGRDQSISDKEASFAQIGFHLRHVAKSIDKMTEKKTWYLGVNIANIRYRTSVRNWRQQALYRDRVYTVFQRSWIFSLGGFS